MLLAQFVRFGMIGALTFLLVTLLVYALRPLLGPTWAGVPSFLIGTTGNWFLNRVWTFRGRHTGGWFAQWVKFMVGSAPALLVNILVYEMLVISSRFISQRPVIALACAAAAGLFVNFTVQRQLVFR